MRESKKAYNQKYYRAHREHYRELARKRRLLKGDVIRAKEREWMHKPENQPRMAAARMRYRARQRAQVLEKFGSKCNKCGFADPRALHVDHVNGGGHQHRKNGGGADINTWLRKRDYPDGYQILCFNCNWGKRVNGGICPHQGVTS